MRKDLVFARKDVVGISEYERVTGNMALQHKATAVKSCSQDTRRFKVVREHNSGGEFLFHFQFARL
jgi:hypothetical protein